MIPSNCAFWRKILGFPPDYPQTYTLQLTILVNDPVREAKESPGCGPPIVKLKNFDRGE